jgi:hypothetical protein
MTARQLLINFAEHPPTRTPPLADPPSQSPPIQSLARCRCGLLLPPYTPTRRPWRLCPSPLESGVLGSRCPEWRVVVVAGVHEGRAAAVAERPTLGLNHWRHLAGTWGHGWHWSAEWPPSAPGVAACHPCTMLRSQGWGSRAQHCRSRCGRAPPPQPRPPPLQRAPFMGMESASLWWMGRRRPSCRHPRQSHWSAARARAKFQARVLHPFPYLCFCLLLLLLVLISNGAMESASCLLLCVFCWSNANCASNVMKFIEWNW